MMKRAVAAISILLSLQCSGQSQDIVKKYDSLNRNWYNSAHDDLRNATSDTDRVKALYELGSYYKAYQPDSGVFYSTQALDLARKIKYVDGEAAAMAFLQLSLLALGNGEKALQINGQVTKLVEKHNMTYGKGIAQNMLGQIYLHFKNYPKALQNFSEAKSIMENLRDSIFLPLQVFFIGETYRKMNALDSAQFYFETALHLAPKSVDWLVGGLLVGQGRIFNDLQQPENAIPCFRKTIELVADAGNYFESNIGIAESYRQLRNIDSSIYYATISMALFRGKAFYSSMVEANTFLSDRYTEKDPAKALSYERKASLYKDSLSNLSKTTSLEYLTAYEEQERQAEINATNLAYRNRIRQYVFIGGLVVLLLIAFILYRNNNQKQKANKVLSAALSDLRSTQSQLIQSEKMASLGELTAGIAHEIQNPLNFVNNFSEVNKELVIELIEDLDKGNLEGAKGIADDILSNEEKIIHHGKRADGIVKGMLQHSRTGSGQMELTDINKLADEYLRLAYHGLRAKEKSFNIKLETDFSSQVGKVNIVPQEIGRVIVNLLNNAFQAILEKTKTTAKTYEPLVKMSTRKLNDKVEIRVRDNGPGIPAKVKDKIFQPFFTTKPTGQGTGLGLSLSYDIIKAHGGQILVETREQEGTEFIILLPAASIT